MIQHTIKKPRKLTDQKKKVVESVDKATGAQLIITENKTPLMLNISLYLLWFGASGLFLRPLVEIIIWIALTVLIPIFITKITGKLWTRITKNVFYKLIQGSSIVGKEAMVKIRVDATGGTISYNDDVQVQLLPAKSLYDDKAFEQNTKVYICLYRDGVYYVDDNPDALAKVRDPSADKQQSKF